MNFNQTNPFRAQQSSGFRMPTFGGNLAAPPASFIGLGGVAGGSGAGGTGLAMTSAPLSSWQSKKDSQSHPVLDTPVPPELMALFNGLKEQMKKHKTTMAEVTQATINIDSVDSVSGEIEKVRAEMNSLVTAIHRQELQCLALVKDIQEISKDAQLMVDLSSGGGAHTFGAFPNQFWTLFIN
ncbi:hypothetical protein Ocin01_18804 [Orchesella cincta]|uniref:Nucleoporin p58/p45 n=1 Tax=Orchesella cincta TaxID=48709 RepID=A0A1D2M4H8_ORCCI|nr:hypothetical protein Ocin01_18804 [Orchesella cincta]